jgi:hypothetical protein
VSAAPLIVDIPAGALPGYALVIVNPNPLTAPLQVSPSSIVQANQTAASQGGTYQSPVSLQEIAAYDLNQQPVTALAQTAHIALAYPNSGGANIPTRTVTPVRDGSLSFFVLDSVHNLWVKMPDTQNNPGGASLTGALTKFGVYAVMGQASGDASSVYVFPTPWRPHGPNAGNGPGQTGTDSGGMTFAALPSECTIRIYTISGSLVRTIHHSDTSGSIAEEVWDGNTSGGEHAASGVYLWRVESVSDSRNGKLMIIR